MNNIHLTMDLMTFLAVCAVTIGAGTFGLTALRIKSKGGGNSVPSKIFEVMNAKVKEFYTGICASERRNLGQSLKVSQKMHQTELRAITEVLRGEITQINTVVNLKIEQVNTTLSEGLIRIEEKIKPTLEARPTKKGS